MISGLKNALLIAAGAVVAILAAAAPVRAQTEPAPVRAFRSFSRGSGSTGLPASTVVSLHTDREGTIWIATFDGIARVEHGAVERLATAKDAPTSGNMFRIIDRRDGGIYVQATKRLYA
jgi:ligand-binding sensor domain-containing protein